MGNKIKTIAVIPCYNTAKTIGDIVRRTLIYVDMVIVVDNDSTDDTKREAQKAGVVVLMCYIKGMGAATSKGISAALIYKPEIIITLDGDGQHDPREIPKLLANLRLKKDIVVGTRDSNTSMPKYRRFGNNVIRLAYNFMAKYQLTDAQCGFRAFTADVAQTIKPVEIGFGCITEFLIKARKHGYKVNSVPINCIYHKNLTDNSTMNPIKHGLGVLLSTIKWRLWEIFS